jgi:phenylacetate-CoA ligase
MNKGEFSYFAYPADINKNLRDLKSLPAAHWSDEGEKMALELFRYTHENIPAYQRFLSEHNVKTDQIKTIADFKKLPLVSKDSYLRPADYGSLFPPAALATATTISATSGSTGEPFFFPRTEANDKQYEYGAEIFLKNQFDIDNNRTLALIGFGLGIWIGGIFTYKNFNRLAERGHDITLIPVGANKDLYLTSFQKFAPFYDQIILMGYPPFIKDVLDAGEERGVNWSNHKLRILTAAEGYSENFRNHIAQKAGIKNTVNDIVNMYGTVEQGTIAYETAFSNLIRRLAAEDEKVFRALFPRATNIPTLAQYHPSIIYFEEVDGIIVATGAGSAIPLVRYQFADLGGVINYDEMLKKLAGLGIDIGAEAQKWGINDKILHLPFVYVYARSDFTVVFRGANIYPGEIRNALDNEGLNKFVTGKATIIRRESETLDQVLEINIELQPGVDFTSSLQEKIADHIVEELRTGNSEYRYLYTTEGANRVKPLVVGWPYQDPKYFSGIGKQSWVKKES